MSDEDKKLWGILGWSQASWEGEDEIPESAEKLWEDITSEEQSAATQLGYTQEKWDDDEEV